MTHAEYILKTKLKGNIYNIKLIFRDTKAIIIGDSATGKSLLYQMINSESNYDGFEAVCYNHEAISVLRRGLQEGHFKYSGKLVVLDNVDVLFDKVPQVIDEINTNHSNNYLIFARSAVGIDMSPNICGKLKFEGNTFYIEYIYPDGMWS